MRHATSRNGIGIVGFYWLLLAFSGFLTTSDAVAVPNRTPAWRSEFGHTGRAVSVFLFTMFKSKTNMERTGNNARGIRYFDVQFWPCIPLQGGNEFRAENANLFPPPPMSQFGTGEANRVPEAGVRVSTFGITQAARPKKALKTGV
jgi:hypothetical protein